MARMDAGFFKRGKNYQIRRVVPGDLQPFLNRKEILKSLGTGDEPEAIRRYRAEATRIDEYFEQQRQIMEGGARLPAQAGADQVIALTAEGIRARIIEDDLRVRERLFAEADQDPENFWSGKLIEIPETEYARHLLHNGDLVPFLSYCIRQKWVSELEATGRALTRGDVREFLAAAAGDTLQARNLLLAKQAALKEVISHTREPVLRETIGEHLAAQNAIAVAPAKGPKLSEVAREWFAKKLRVKEWTPNTRDEHEAALAAFTAVCGDKPIGSYSKADGRKFKTVLLRVPSNAHKKAEYNALTLLEAADKAEKAGEADLLSPVTVNKLIRKVSAFFTHCMASYDECTSNPMAGQTDRAKQGQADDRDPFTIEQLKTIFDSPLYSGCKSEARWYDAGSATLEHTAKFWVFLIGIFSGARLGEIVQLHVDDIKAESDIPYFDFSETEPDHPYPKSLKTSASSRRTPIHPQLLELGFLEFVNAPKKQGAVRLFPDAITEGSNKPSNKMSKFYATFLDRLGIKGNKEVFHSTRHNFKDACRRAQIPDDVSKALMGHEQDGMSARYGTGGSGFGLENLANAISSVQYQKLSFAHIKSFGKNKLL